MYKPSKRYKLQTILDYRQDASIAIDIARMEFIQWDLLLRLGVHSEFELAESVLFEEPAALATIQETIRLNRLKRRLKERGIWTPKSARKLKRLVQASRI